MSVIINGDTGITTPAETVQGALTTTGNTILGDSSADTLNVGNGGLVKDASGNVGIGTASPAAKLDVSANARVGQGQITADSTVGNLGIYGGMASATTNAQLSFFGKSVSNTGATYEISRISGASFGPYSLDGGLQFSTASNNGSNVLTLAEQARISSAGVFSFNSGYGSVATAYGCRAWVNFNGTGTVAIRASGNVSSITDNGTGNYTVNLTTAMTDANYCVVANAVNAGVASAFAFPEVSSSSAVAIQTATRAVPGTNADVNGIYVAIFR